MEEELVSLREENKVLREQLAQRDLRQVGSSAL